MAASQAGFGAWPSAWQRDASIAAAWTTYQTEVRRLRQEFQTAQAADNAALRNAMATADQTQINAVTQARELYTNSVEDERHEATVDRANDWVSKISQLVRLNATSSNGLAQSLADAIRNMATQYPVTTIGGMSALGQPMMGVSQANPFWMALANKAELAADYLSSVNRAQTNYLTGRTEIVGGDVAILLPGMLQHQADLRISQSAATRDYNKATVEAAGQRDRTLANTRTNLAAAKGTWEEGLVAQTDANTTVEKPSLDPPTTQTPTATTTARQLSTLFSGGLVSAEPAPQQNGTVEESATAENSDIGTTVLPFGDTPTLPEPPAIGGRPKIRVSLGGGLWEDVPDGMPFDLAQEIYGPNAVFQTVLPPKPGTPGEIVWGDGATGTMTIYGPNDVIPWAHTGVRVPGQNTQVHRCHGTQVHRQYTGAMHLMEGVWVVRMRFLGNSAVFFAF